LGIAFQTPAGQHPTPGPKDYDMKLDPNLVGSVLEVVPSSWDERDCALYALGIGAGQQDPAGELEFTTDARPHRPQLVYPTFGVIHGGNAAVPPLLAALGDAVDFSAMLHGEQKLEQLETLPSQAKVISQARVSAAWDKGSATVIETVTETRDARTDTLYCRSTQSMFFRGVGGWGGDRGPATAKWSPPSARPTRTLTATSRPDQALLYRLSGDANPLHVDPVVARAAGFARPILHGLCAYGIVGRVLLNSYVAADPTRFTSLQVRFSQPTMPGDTLTIQTWLTSPGVVEFQTINQDGAAVHTGGLFAFT
jgi:acyl dehydratase